MQAAIAAAVAPSSAPEPRCQARCSAGGRALNTHAGQPPPTAATLNLSRVAKRLRGRPLSGPAPHGRRSPSMVRRARVHWPRRSCGLRREWPPAPRNHRGESRSRPLRRGALTGPQVLPRGMAPNTSTPTPMSAAGPRRALRSASAQYLPWKRVQGGGERTRKPDPAPAPRVSGTSLHVVVRATTAVGRASTRCRARYSASMMPELDSPVARPSADSATARAALAGTFRMERTGDVLLAKQHSRSVGRAPFLGLFEEFASIDSARIGLD